MNKTTKITFLAFLLLQLFTACGQQQDQDYWEELPVASGRVNDFEGILQPNQLLTIDSILGAYENATGREIAIITIPPTNTDSTTFDSLVVRIFNSWGVGKKQLNDGVLIGISSGLRKIRIVNGTGIEKLVSNNETKELIDTYFIPAFKNGDYNKGLLDGLAALITKLNTAADKGLPSYTDGEKITPAVLKNVAHSNDYNSKWRCYRQLWKFFYLDSLSVQRGQEKRDYKGATGISSAGGVQDFTKIPKEKLAKFFDLAVLANAVTSEPVNDSNFVYEDYEPESRISIRILDDYIREHPDMNDIYDLLPLVDVDPSNCSMAFWQVLFDAEIIGDLFRLYLEPCGNAGPESFLFNCNEELDKIQIIPRTPANFNNYSSMIERLAGTNYSIHFSGDHERQIVVKGENAYEFQLEVYKVEDAHCCATFLINYTASYQNNSFIIDGPIYWKYLNAEEGSANDWNELR